MEFPATPIFIVIQDQVISRSRSGGIVIEPANVAKLRGIRVERLGAFDFGPGRNDEIIQRLINKRMTIAQLLDKIDNI